MPVRLRDGPIDSASSARDIHPQTFPTSPGRFRFAQLRSKMNRERARIMNLAKRRWVLGFAVFAITAVSYAQWSNPAEDVPAYHPSAPLKVAALPPSCRERS